MPSSSSGLPGCLLVSYRPLARISEAREPSWKPDKKRTALLPDGSARRSKEPNYSELPNQRRRREPVHVEVLLLGEEREVVGPRPPVVQVPLRRGQQPVAGDGPRPDDRVGPVDGGEPTRTRRGAARRRPRSTRARTLMLLIRRRVETRYLPKEGSRSATGGATGASGRTGRRPVVRGRSARPLEGDASRTATPPWAGSSGFWIATPRRTPRRRRTWSSSSRSGSRRCRRSRLSNLCLYVAPRPPWGSAKPILV